MSGWIDRALRVIAAHPNVVSISNDVINSDTSTRQVDVAIRLGLPNAWMADGHSPNGIRSIEPVTFLFPASFPLKAPTLRLRADFDRSVAHVRPGEPGDRPEPCIFEGNLTELQQQQGVAGIINQLVVWLENAALERLINPAQGWEPVRRDGLRGFIIADAAVLRGLVSRKAGYAAFGFEYWSFSIDSGGPGLHGEIDREQLTLNPKTTHTIFTERQPVKGKDWRIGRSLALVSWPGRHASGELVIADRYQPETVTDVGSLFTRADEYGCGEPLRAGLRWLETCLSGYEASSSRPIVVVLCARRPFHIIGSDSAIELCPYVVEIVAQKLLPAGDRTAVRPAGHRHSISVPLLRQLSGGDFIEETPAWIQIGCGSLGSKIALHLARAGRAPVTVIDSSNLSPHNAARHGLVPASGPMQLPWMGSKAEALAQAIEGLGQRTEAISRDVVEIVRDKKEVKRVFPRKAWAVVNSTASLSVREALGSVPSGAELPRVIETSLFANGRLGLISVEGPGRNPDTLDLIAEMYVHARENEGLRAVIFGSRDALTWQAIGEGCGSATMIMSDARISMYAAPMAETISRMQSASLPDLGRVLVGAVAADGIGVAWSDHAVAPAVVVPVEGGGDWRVRVSARAAVKIAREVEQWPGVETGGIVMGRISEAGQTFYIADVLPAPPDSQRAAHEFILGTDGAGQMICEYAESCGYSLFCLGTWHNHLTASGASNTDRKTAAAVGLARLAPCVLLIRTPAGFSALLADASGSDQHASERDKI
jgi:hypothetical protein